MSKKKMILEQIINPDSLPHDKANCNLWLVKKVVGSTTPRILDRLTRTEVDGYCEREDWEVTIQ